MEYIRFCPKCEKELKYRSKNAFSIANNKNKKCISCSKMGDNWVDVNNLKRKCPECEKVYEYSNITSYRTAIKNNSLCGSCQQKGERNHAFGKIFTDEEKAKYSEILKRPEIVAKRKLAVKNYYINNPDDNVYARVLKKHKDNLEDFYKEKYKDYSKMFSGENNPMFGKPSPQGSGNGWSGWYMEHFFRSLIELSYMVEFLSASGTIWQSAETKEFKIEYTDVSGQIRNYFPDFFVNNKYLVEIKPKRLFKSESVKLKKQAAEKWCLENGYEYLLIEPKKLSNDKIMELYNAGEIKFTERYEEKFAKRYKL